MTDEYDVIAEELDEEHLNDEVNPWDEFTDSDGPELL